MPRNVRTYDHFCMLARALERVGDRWTMLVIRDLMTGAKRFTDLMDRLGGITPKTLSQRLRELEDAGIVTADREPGRREVHYRLTPAGTDLAPAIDALSWWGLRHAWRLPHPGEPLHLEHLLRAAVQAIEHTTDDHAATRWHIRVHDDGDYLIVSDGHRWSVTTDPPHQPADLTITVHGTTDAWMRFAADPTRATAEESGIDLDGSNTEIRRFLRLMRLLPAIVAK
jgi:DNA-binding HxlR family transcriptional regulator